MTDEQQDTFPSAQTILEQIDYKPFKPSLESRYGVKRKRLNNTNARTRTIRHLPQKTS